MADRVARLGPELVEEMRCAVRDRLERLLDRAIAAKRAGVGAMARPEADWGLLRIVHCLDEYDPSAGWARRAYATMAHCVDTHARRLRHTAWPDYVQSMRSNEPPAPEGVFSALRRRVFSSRGSEEVVASSPPGFDTTPIRDAFVDLGSEMVFAAEERVRVADAIGASQSQGKVDLNAASEAVSGLERLPGGFPEPLWRNETIPKTPKGGAKVAWEIGWCLCHVAREITASVQGFQVMAYRFGAPMAKRHKKWTPEGTRTAHVVDSLLRRPRPVFDEGVWGVPALDVVFGGDPEAFLRACLADDRARLQRGAWSRSVFGINGMISGTPASRDPWIDSVACGPRYRSGVGDRMHRLLFDEELEGGVIAPCSNENSHDRAFCDAMDAVHQRDAPKCNDAVEAMLASYRRCASDTTWKHTDMRAIGVQRCAIRRGMTINVPDHACNMPAVVELPDPLEPEAYWSACPGMEILASSPTPLEWPTLWLGRPIDVIEDPLGTKR